jgi:hypothetical protein
VAGKVAALPQIRGQEGGEKYVPAWGEECSGTGNPFRGCGTRCEETCTKRVCGQWSGKRNGFRH